MDYNFWIPFSVMVVCLIFLYPCFKVIVKYYYNHHFNKKPFILTYYDEDGNKTEHYLFNPKSKDYMVEQSVKNTLTPLHKLSKKPHVRFEITFVEPEQIQTLTKNKKEMI